MKIIHTGDIHIGSAFSLLSAEKARLRQAEITDGFRRLCAYARENKIEVVLIAGDLFDDNGVSPQVKNETLAAIAAAAPTIFFYVSGNHDDEFYAQGDLPNNLYVFSQHHGWKGYDLPENVFDWKGLSVLRVGLRLGEVKNGRFEPSHSLALASKKEDVKNVVDLPETDLRVEKYLRGETIEAEQAPNGWCAVCVAGFPIGLGKAVNGVVKNHIPKGLRIQ